MHGHYETVIHELLLTIDVRQEALEIAHQKENDEKSGFFCNNRFDKALAVNFLDQGISQ